MKNNLKITMGLVATLASLFVSAIVPSRGVAEEDDGRPYAEIAKRIGPSTGFAIPKTALSYDHWFTVRLRKYLDAMDENLAKSGQGASISGASCAAFYEPVLRDRMIEIRYALGYFDDSTGHPMIHANLDWGNSASMDEGVWFAIRHILTEPCKSEARRLCGFTETTSQEERVRSGETVLVRKMDVRGQSVEVRMTLTYASASPFYERNKTVLQAKQERYTRNSEENFFGGLRTADYVFYMGHSRNGGGPDFNPPRLNSAGKPNYYGYYRKEFPGITRLLRELKTAGNRDVTIGLFSCDSKLHFHRKLLNQNKNQRMILTLGGEGVLDYGDTFSVSFGYLEGLLRGACGSPLDDFARATAREKNAFQQYGLK